MSLLSLFVLIIVTCGAFWLWRIAYNHAGAVPDAPPIAKWALQGITIIILIVVVCALWGYGSGYLEGPVMRLE